MATKVYGIYGRTEAHINLPVNRGLASLKLEFTKGCIAPGPGYRPATYTTNSKVEQILIENSPSYGGLIKLVRAFGDEEPEASAAPVSKPAHTATAEVQDKDNSQETKSYPDVTDIDQVRTVLKASGAKAPTLTSLNAMAKWAKANNIEFPNFSFE